MKDEEFSTSQAAAYLGIRRQSVLALAQRNNIGRRIGHAWVFKKSELDKWLAKPRDRRGPKKLMNVPV